MSNDKVFSQPTWAIVELFGHNMIAGEISEVDVAGTQMLRVDVPAIDEIPGFTKIYGGGAIYAITPTDEAAAMYAVRSLRQRPIKAWVIPDRQLPPETDAMPEGGTFSEWETD